MMVVETIPTSFDISDARSPMPLFSCFDAPITAGGVVLVSGNVSMLDVEA